MDSKTNRRLGDVGEELALVVDQDNVTVVGANHDTGRVLDPSVAGVVFGYLVGDGGGNYNFFVVTFKFCLVVRELIVTIALGSCSTHDTLSVDVLETQLESSLCTRVGQAEINAPQNLKLFPVPVQKAPVRLTTESYKFVLGRLGVELDIQKLFAFVFNFLLIFW